MRLVCVEIRFDLHSGRREPSLAVADRIFKKGAAGCSRRWDLHSIVERTISK